MLRGNGNYFTISLFMVSWVHFAFLYQICWPPRLTQLLTRPKQSKLNFYYSFRTYHNKNLNITHGREPFHHKKKCLIILSIIFFEEETTSWSLARQLHLVPSLAFWSWLGSIKRGIKIRCSNATQQDLSYKNKKEREARPGLLGLKASGILLSRVKDFAKKNEITNLPDCTVDTHLVSLHSSWHSNQAL